MNKNRYDDICIVVLNYNGIYFLKSLIPSVLHEISKCRPKCRLIVLDNRSSEDDLLWMQENYPNVECIVAPQNACLYSYNWLIPQLKEKYVLLLNNDLILLPNFIDPLISRMNDPSVFSVGATSRNWENSAYTAGPSKLETRYGLYYYSFDCTKQVPCYTLATIGGFMLVNREHYVKLGGFDPIYYPGYCEEGDLCLRAWRNGLKCVFEPRSIALHYDGGSFSKIRKTRQFAQLRSQFIFQWTHFPSIYPKWAMILSCILRGTKHLLMGNSVYIKAFYSAYKSYQRELGKRMQPMNKDEYQRIIEMLRRPLPEKAG